MKKAIIPVLGALFLWGCQSLPQGTPPSGAIVDPYKVEDAMSSDAAVNYMVTSISMRCPPIANSGGRVPFVGMKFNKSSDPLSRVLPERFFRELLKISLVKFDFSKPAEYCIVSELVNEKASAAESGNTVWTLKLVSPDEKTEFWRERVVLKKEKDR